jgi:hypothetical protein
VNIVHLGMSGGHSASLRQMRAVLVKSPGQESTHETIMVASVPQQTWFDPAGQSALPAQFPDGPLHSEPTGMQRIGGSLLASRQHVVTPGWQTSNPHGIGASDAMSTWASLGDSMNLQPWVGAPPQHPDICATIAADPTTAPETSRLAKNANSRAIARR